jgi:hypothetical protein
VYPESASQNAFLNRSACAGHCWPDAGRCRRHLGSSQGNPHPPTLPSKNHISAPPCWPLPARSLQFIFGGCACRAQAGRFTDRGQAGTGVSNVLINQREQVLFLLSGCALALVPFPFFLASVQTLALLPDMEAASAGDVRWCCSRWRRGAPPRERSIRCGARRGRHEPVQVFAHGVGAPKPHHAHPVARQALQQIVDGDVRWSCSRASSPSHVSHGPRRCTHSPGVCHRRLCSGCSSHVWL